MVCRRIRLFLDYRINRMFWQCENWIVLRLFVDWSILRYLRRLAMRCLNFWRTVIRVDYLGSVSEWEIRLLFMMMRGGFYIEIFDEMWGCFVGLIRNRGICRLFFSWADDFIDPFFIMGMFGICVFLHS